MRALRGVLLMMGVLVGAGAESALARGLYLETPAWYEPAYVDTQMTLTLGVSHLRARTDATRFFVGIAPVRRGLVEFGGSLPYLFVRSPDGSHAGVGDPRVDARVRLPLPETWPVRMYLDGTVRLPTASDELFPYAHGAQDFAFSGTLSIPRLLGFFAGAGRIFSEPPSESTLRRADVPRATHVWSAMSAHRRPWWLAARGDVLLFAVDGARRGVAKLTLGWHDPDAFTVLFDWSVEFGSRSDRVFDHGPTLRFATPLL